MTPEKFLQLRKDIEQVQRKLDHERGELNGLLKRLKVEFECSTIEEAEAELVKIKSSIQKREESLNTKLKQFDKQWSKYLETDPAED